MNEVIHCRTSQTASGTIAFALGAAMVAGHAAWPAPEIPTYVVPQRGSTYSPFSDQALSFAPSVAATHFAREIATIYAALSEKQQPLGREFEAALFDDIESLYEA